MDTTINNARRQDDPPGCLGFRGYKFVMFNFCLMSLLFSANHGTVVALVGIASAVNENMSGVQNAVFYGSYTLSALIFANLFVSKLGSKGAIVLGMGTYCLYSLCFLALHYIAPQKKSDCVVDEPFQNSTTTSPFTTDSPVDHNMNIEWMLVILSSFLSGLGAGGLWTAQVSFMSTSAKRHAAMTGITVEKATGLYSTIFPCFYLSMELLMRILSSVINISCEKNLVKLFIVYSGVAVGSLVLMILFVRPMEEKVVKVPMFQKVSGMFSMMVTDPRILLMAPYNFTFSFASSFLNEYVNGQILQKNQIGWFGAILVGSAVLFSSAFGVLLKNTRLPKMIPMIAGSLAFIGVMLILALKTNEQLKNYYALLVPLYLLFGCGRGIWESTMKGVFADFFGTCKMPAAAFANIAFQNGLAGAAGFLVFAPRAPNRRNVGVISVLAIAVLGIVCYLIADQINRHRQRQAQVGIRKGLLSTDQ